jgi:hypothetical protein
MKISRRDLLVRSAATALIAGSPELASAGTHGVSGFNGGRSQGQANPPYLGDFPFVNLLKNSFGWYTNAGSGNFDISQLDSNGYPTAGSVSSKSTATFGVLFPNSSERLSDSSNPIVVTWEGNSRIAIQNAPFTYVSGRDTAILNGYGYTDGKYHGRYVFYPSYASDGSFNCYVGFQTVTSYALNLAVFFSDDEYTINAGGLFAVTPQHGAPGRRSPIHRGKLRNIVLFLLLGLRLTAAMISR